MNIVTSLLSSLSYGLDFSYYFVRRIFYPLTPITKITYDTAVTKSFRKKIYNNLDHDASYPTIYVNKNATLDDIIKELQDACIRDCDFYIRVMKNDSSHNNSENIIFHTPENDILLKIIFDPDYIYGMYNVSEQLCKDWNDGIMIGNHNHVSTKSANKVFK